MAKMNVQIVIPFVRDCIHVRILTISFAHLRSGAKTFKSSILVFLALLSLSPVLRTLTAATSSDSIWALSACLFGLNTLLADYTALRFEGHHRERYTLHWRTESKATLTCLQIDVYSFHERSDIVVCRLGVAITRCHVGIRPCAFFGSAIRFVSNFASSPTGMRSRLFPSSIEEADVDSDRLRRFTNLFNDMSVWRVNLVDYATFKQHKLPIRLRVRLCYVRRPRCVGMGTEVQKVCCLVCDFC